MPAPYFHLLGHIFLAVESCEHNSSLASALKKAGLGKDDIQNGAELMAAADELIERKDEELGDNRIYEHNTHNAASEVEMWKSTVAFRLKKAVDDDSLIEKTLGNELHGSNHTVTLVAQSLRIIAMIRAEPKLHEALGTGRKVEDLIIRGWTLLNKLFKNGQILMSPNPTDDPDHEIFSDIAEHYAAMQAWVEKLGRATEKMTDHASLLGELGYIPEGVGMPLGGTAYGVPLHEKAQREDLPDATDLRPDPGWSAGRQGRNRENLGGGWVEPSFK